MIARSTSQTESRRPEWIEPPAFAAEFTALHPDPLIAALLGARGFTARAEVAGFLQDRSDPMPDPDGVPGMAAAVARVGDALDAGERIAIFGDYDADGITATAILASALRAANADPGRVTARLPRRSEGYGLRTETVDELADGGAQLLLAVDCGSSDHDAVRRARERGLDVVIVDHHQMRDAGPEGAIVASTRVGDHAASRYNDLTGAGLAYVLVVGLARHGYAVAQDGGSEADYLDLVAIGTIADVAPLTGLNRAFVKRGLARINTRPRLGIARLLRRVGVEPGQVTARTIAFKISPRLNAAGRISDPSPALDLMLSRDPIEADRLVATIEGFNERRKIESRRIEQSVDDQLATRDDLDAVRLLVCSGPGWPAGLLGIVAARLAERYGRPAIVLTDQDGMSSGSARSIPGIDITEALNRCGELIGRHGGHSQAAGLSLATADLVAVERRLGELIDDTGVIVPFIPRIELDAVLPAHRLSLATVEALAALEPFGEGNRQPTFLIRNVPVRDYSTMGADRSHLRVTVETGNGQEKVILWGGANRSRELLFQPRIDIAATIDADYWNGRTRVHIEAVDFRPAR